VLLDTSVAVNLERLYITDQNEGLSTMTKVLRTWRDAAGHGACRYLRAQAGETDGDGYAAQMVAAMGGGGCIYGNMEDDELLRESSYGSYGSSEDYSGTYHTHAYTLGVHTTRRTRTRTRTRMRTKTKTRARSDAAASRRGNTFPLDTHTQYR
jgi:hypothetical protein